MKTPCNAANNNRSNRLGLDTGLLAWRFRSLSIVNFDHSTLPRYEDALTSALRLPSTESGVLVRV
jgi:hypothetical protein